MSSLRKEYGPIDKIKVWFGSRSVVVFTMGKVGTLTVCNSLRNIGYRHVHPHSLRVTRPGVHFVEVELSPLATVKYLIMTLLKRIKVYVWKLVKKEILIISGVRDPYSRNISAFFEQIHYVGGIEESATFEDIKREYTARCKLEAPLEWFDSEVLPLTGIDVFAHPFDIARGFAEIRKGKFRVFVFRVDKLNGLADEIGRFINDSNFDIISTNVSSEGQYGKQLAEFKKKYKYEPSIAKTYSGSKYMTHFFSQDEVQGYAKRWVDGG